MHKKNLVKIFHEREEFEEDKQEWDQNQGDDQPKDFFFPSTRLICLTSVKDLWSMYFIVDVWFYLLCCGCLVLRTWLLGSTWLFGSTYFAVWFYLVVWSYVLGCLILLGCLVLLGPMYLAVWFCVLGYRWFSLTMYSVMDVLILLTSLVVEIF